jgi:hypothetical protein
MTYDDSEKALARGSIGIAPIRSAGGIFKCLLCGRSMRDAGKQWECRCGFFTSRYYLAPFRASTSKPPSRQRSSAATVTESKLGASNDIALTALDREGAPQICGISKKGVYKATQLHFRPLAMRHLQSQML